MAEEAEVSPGVVALKWWRRLTDPMYGDRATFARLRRCENAVDAIAITQAIALARDLGRHQMGERGFNDSLGVAVVLAHVRENDPKNKLMRAAGWKSFPGNMKETTAGENRPLLSELRFRRLLQTVPDERISAFKRLVKILGGKANVADLAESFLFWGDGRRQRWAFDYFAAAVPTPVSDNPHAGADQ